MSRKKRLVIVISLFFFVIFLCVGIGALTYYLGEDTTWSIPAGADLISYLNSQIRLGHIASVNENAQFVYYVHGQRIGIVVLSAFDRLKNAFSLAFCGDYGLSITRETPVMETLGWPIGRYAIYMLTYVLFSLIPCLIKKGQRKASFGIFFLSVGVAMLVASIVLIRFGHNDGVGVFLYGLSLSCFVAGTFLLGRLRYPMAFVACSWFLFGVGATFLPTLNPYSQELGPILIEAMATGDNHLYAVAWFFLSLFWLGSLAFMPTFMLFRKKGVIVSK